MFQAQINHFIDAVSKTFLAILALCCTGFLYYGGYVFAEDAFPLLVKESCIQCHDGSQDNQLDLNDLGTDLSDSKTFAMWVRIHDRMDAGEMPPLEVPRPDSTLLKQSLKTIAADLTKENLANQKKNGRTVLRRLTRTELQHTLNDLLLTHLDLSEILPPENSSSDFDTIASEQGLSPIHVRAYIDAADAAIEGAIKVGPEPDSQNRVFQFQKQKSTRNHLDRKNKVEDKVVLLELDDSVVMFHTAAYLFQLDDFYIRETGVYRIKATAAAYQTRRPVTLTLNVGHYNKGYTKAVGFYDLPPKKKVTPKRSRKDNDSDLDKEDDKNSSEESLESADQSRSDELEKLGDFKTYEVETVLRRGNYVFPRCV